MTAQEPRRATQDVRVALARASVAPTLYGHDKPRIAPPVPARSDLAGFRETAAAMAIELMPWQEVAARYLTATGPTGLLLYREVCIVVARQNGKTTLMKPLIVRGLRAGKRIIHLAQNRELPRIMFGTIADALSDEPELFPKRRGRTIWPRYGSGQEEITLANGGSYRIAAASRGGARGHPTDYVIIDELREMESDEVVGAAEPTLTMSTDPQMVYLSNAGTETSVVLNSVRDRSGKDVSLAYLEWSAAPERDAGDVEGWAEANPTLGHFPQVMRTLETSYNRHTLSNTMTTFETEHLCRWVVTMRPHLVDEASWLRGRAEEVGRPRQPAFGISMDPSGTRASVVMAWRQTELTADGRPTFAIKELFDVPGEPIDTDALGEDAMAMARKMGAMTVGYDDATDRDLARHFAKKAKAIIGKDFANATEAFVRAVQANQIRWVDGEHITADLKATSRKDNDETGTYYAVKSKDDLPVTAAFAAIRAFWLASGSSPGRPKVY